MRVSADVEKKMNSSRVLSRRTPRLAAVAVVVAVVVALVATTVGSIGTAGAAVPQPARALSADGPSWRTEERVVPVRTGPRRDIPIGIDTRLYVPERATARRPQPAIVMTNGFGLDKDAAEILTTARFFAAHGYVVLTYSASGFGDSGGCITLQSMDYDVQYAKQLISTVLGSKRYVARDRRGPVVGTVGGSYGGGIQLPLAAADKRVRATIPGRTWNQLAYSLDPNNRVVPGDRSGFAHARNAQGVFKQEWTSLFFASGNAQPAQGNGGCPEAKVAAGDPVELAGAPGCQGYYLPVCHTNALIGSTGDADAASRRLLARASGATFLRTVTAPTLLVQGQSDTLFNLNDATATYVGLRRLGVPTAMIWNSGGHGGYTSEPGECEAYDGVERSVRQMDRCYLPRRQLGWMNHWLRGTRAGQGPGFSYYQDWRRYAGSGPNDEQYGTAPRLAPNAGRTFYLAGSTGLVARKRFARAGRATFVSPAGGAPTAYTETSNFSGPDAQPSSSAVPPTEAEGQHVDFTSRRFRSAVNAVGIPRAHLVLRHANGRDLVFFGKVYDVAPDGSSTLLHRLIAPVRVPAGAVSTPVDLKLLGFAHRFRAGHRVRLTLASTDATSYHSQVADVVTVLSGRRSSFTLPVAPRR